MPRFVSSHAPDLLLSANYKAMFTTLKKDAALRSISEAGFLRRLAFSRIASAPARHYMVVRHPYDRAISFYYDKLENDLRNPEKNAWQHSQKRLFPLAGVTGAEDFETIRAALMEVSLSAFIEFIPSILKNRHLRPQTALLGGAAGALLTRTVFLRMENDLERLAEIFSVDVGVKRNATLHPEFGRALSREDRRILNAIYKKDFQTLPYDPA